MRVMLIESASDELVPESYAKTVMKGAHRKTHWKTLEISEEDFQRYEELRLALNELLTELQEEDEEEEEE